MSLISPSLELSFKLKISAQPSQARIIYLLLVCCSTLIHSASLLVNAAAFAWLSITLDEILRVVEVWFSNKLNSIYETPFSKAWLLSIFRQFTFEILCSCVVNLRLSCCKLTTNAHDNFTLVDILSNFQFVL